MSLLGNRNNDFEKKLKDQLGDTELRPSESLWDRIDKEVNRPEFEQRVEGKVGQYEVKPKPETWTYIEEQLPPEPSRWKRTGKIWYGVAILLFFGGAFAGYQLSHLPESDMSYAPSVNIESAGTDSHDIKEIVGGSDQQSESVILPEVTENTAAADKIAAKDQENSAAVRSGVSPDLHSTTLNAAAQESEKQPEQIGTNTEKAATGSTQQPQKPAIAQGNNNQPATQVHANRNNPVIVSRQTTQSENRRKIAGVEKTRATSDAAVKPVATTSGNKSRGTIAGVQSPSTAAAPAKTTQVADRKNIAQQPTSTAGSPQNKETATVAGSTVPTNTALTQANAEGNANAKQPVPVSDATQPKSNTGNIAPLTTAAQNNGTGAPERTAAETETSSAGNAHTEDPAAVAPSQPSQPEDTSRTAAKTASGKVMEAVNDSVVHQIPAGFNDMGTETPTRLSISILAGLHQSNMRLVAPENKNMDENMALRRQVERPKIDFTGGFLLDYEVSPHVLISTGILFTGFSMNLKYNVSPAAKEASPQPGATYTNSSDSILKGAGMSNRIHYSWNEIPLLVTIRFSPAKRFGFEAKTGVSYAMLNSVDAAMVGQENVGVLLLKNKESFPYMKNSLFAHLYLGASYQLNESVAIQLMPYFRYSLSNMIDNENWVKQYPWMMGVSFGLRKSF